MSAPEALPATWDACDGWRPAKGPRSPWKTRYFLDTEFTDFDAFQPISVAIVGEDGREFYAERTDFEASLCSVFTREAVLPLLGRLPGRAMPLDQLRNELQAWLLAIPLKPKPVLCYDFEGDVDLLGRLLGCDLPRGWKLENVKQKIDVARRSAFLAQQGGAHHALQDARANACAFL